MIGYIRSRPSFSEWINQIWALISFFFFIFEIYRLSFNFLEHWNIFLTVSKAHIVCILNDFYLNIFGLHVFDCVKFWLMIRFFQIIWLAYIFQIIWFGLLIIFMDFEYLFLSTSLRRRYRRIIGQLTVHHHKGGLVKWWIRDTQHILIIKAVVLLLVNNLLQIEIYIRSLPNYRQWYYGMSQLRYLICCF